MMIEDDARSPVQDTVRHYDEEPPHLSIEETPLNPQISAEHESTSAKKCKWQNVDKMLTNVDVKFDNRAIEDRGTDHKPSTCNGQGLMEFSCNGPNSNASEDRRKTLDDTSVKDNVSSAFHQDGNTTMSCALDNNVLVPEGHSLKKSTTQFSDTEHNAKVGYRSNDEKRAIPEASNDSTSNHFESGQNGDVGCRSSDDVLAHHEGNMCPPLVCQTGRHTSSACIGCNQSANILKIDVGTSTDPYDTGRKSKKRRRRNKCRADNVPIDRNPEDKISSCQERNKIGPSSQNQAPVIEKSPNALAATSNTSFQQDGNVSVMTRPARHTSLLGASEIYISSGSQIMGEGHSRACKSSSGSTALKNASNIFPMFFRNFKILVVLIIVASMMAQASPVQKQWQQFQFCRKDGPLNDQVLTIRNMEDRRSEDCTVIFPSVPFFKNCSESRSLVFVENSMCVVMLTKDLTTEHFRMEYGSNLNNTGLEASRGERVNEKLVLEKLAEFTETADGSAQRLSSGDNTRTDDSRWQQFWFHMTSGSLIDQVLTIKDMKDRNSEGCSFTIPAVPFFHNCSQSRFLVFVKNETCAEMLTKDPTAEDWRMECGRTRNGHDLPAVRGGTLNEKSVLEKITEYREPANGSAQGWSAEDIVKIAAGVGALLLILVVVLSLLYSFCPNFKSWVDEVVCRRGRRNTNNVPQTGANLESNTHKALLQNTSTNGTTNGGLQNGESKSETLSVGLLKTDQMKTDTTTQAEDSL